MPRIPRLAVVLSILAVIIVACSAPGGVSAPERTDPPKASPSASPRVPPASPSIRPSVSPSTPPVAAPRPTPTPTPPARAEWTRRIAIDSKLCSELSATVDSSGRFHVTAVCDGRIQYATSADAATWKSELVSPIDIRESGPQVVADGKQIHLGFTKYVPLDEGCGGQELRPVGVFIQLRDAASKWSTPRRIGVEADVLIALRIVDGTVHALVSNDGLFYVSVDGDVTKRVKIADAGTGSLRVGDDGVARVAWLSNDEIRYGRIEGDRVRSQLVAEADFGVGAPQLILAPGNRPFVSWTQNSEIGGCASPGPQPADGTYVASLAGDDWTSRRVSKSPWDSTLTLDVASGNLHLAVVDEGIRHLVSTDDGATWTSKLVPNSVDAYSPVIRFDSATRRVAIAALVEDGVVVFRLG